jgi:hypothetical protein
MFYHFTILKSNGVKVIEFKMILSLEINKIIINDELQNVS